MYKLHHKAENKCEFLANDSKAECNVHTVTYHTCVSWQLEAMEVKEDRLCVLHRGKYYRLPRAKMILSAFVVSKLTFSES